jgi:PKD repeat protein
MMGGCRIVHLYFVAGLLAVFLFSFPATAHSFDGGLVVDHNAVHDFDDIPVLWLDAAKQLTLHYAHTSHGSQIISGIQAMKAANPDYGVAVRESGTEGLPPQEDPPVLRIYDGNPPATYITPDLYWDSVNGMNATRGVAATGHYNFSMWSWCGQQSGNDTNTVNRYLTNLNQLESEFPAMRFILMTGHTDGSNTPTEPGTLKYNNALVRNYALSNDKVLFDFADIESWDPAGNNYPTTTDACDWCADWCTANPADCQNLTGSCAHTHPFNCKLKAKAFWYMMARLAGWGGNNEPTDFTATPLTGTNPTQVNFTDTSTHNPTSWSWDFGDGGTSMLQNPGHWYKSAGSYTVSLTATGNGGAFTRTKNGFIVISACGFLPVKIEGRPDYFSSIQGAFDSQLLVEDDTIQTQGVDFQGDMTWSKHIQVSLTGGFGCDYSPNPGGFTTIQGSLTVAQGTLAVDRVIIR